MATVAAIIPAAGAGKRFGGAMKKPFVQLDGRPVFIRSIELFVSRPEVKQILLTVSPDDYDVVREKYAANLMFMNIKLVQGGAERFESVRRALEHVDPECELVCVHDAVRPCVLPAWIDQVFERAAKTGAAILAAPVHGTLKRVADGAIRETVSRASLFEAQTPQVFRRQMLLEAYAAMPADRRPTDDAQVVEWAGHSVAIVESDHRNLKLTHGSDLSLAQAVLKDFASARRPSGGPRGPFEEAQW